jgi:hypothetical protein
MKEMTQSLSELVRRIKEAILLWYRKRPEFAAREPVLDGDCIKFVLQNRQHRFVTIRRQRRALTDIQRIEIERLMASIIRRFKLVMRSFKNKKRAVVVTLALPA